MTPAQAVPDRPFTTVYDEDLELAWWADGQVPGTDPPTWCGPIVNVDHQHGKLTVTAFSQEWHPTRSVMGMELVNHLDHATPGVDTDLSEWTTITGPAPTSSTTDLYTEVRSMVLAAGSVVVAECEMPPSPGGNVMHFALAVRMPAGTIPTFGVVAEIVRYEDPTGGTAYGPTPTDRKLIAAAQGVAVGEWLFLGDALAQPATSGTRWELRVFAGQGGPTTIGAVRASRMENASAEAGWDWSLAAASILAQQADLMTGTWSYDVDPAALDLAGDARWLSQDHQDVVTVLGDLDGIGEWWVDDGVLRWAPTRGSQVATMTLTGDDLADWTLSVDASQAATEVIGQLPVDSGDLREQVRVAVAGAGARMVTVEQVPDGIAPADARTWAQALLDSSTPRVTLSGVPAVWTGDPEDVLGDLTPGDWVEVTIVDELVTYTVTPAVDEVAWHPITGRVEPTWVLGGQRGQDPMAVLVAELRRSRRDRRTATPARPALEQQSIPFTFYGPAAASTSPRWTPPARVRVSGAAVTANTAGGSDLTVTVRVNGTAVRVITLASGETSIEDPAATFAVDQGDYVQIQLSGATGAGDVTVILYHWPDV